MDSTSSFKSHPLDDRGGADATCVFSVCLNGRKSVQNNHWMWGWATMLPCNFVICLPLGQVDTNPPESWLNISTLHVWWLDLLTGQAICPPHRGGLSAPMQVGWPPTFTDPQMTDAHEPDERANRNHIPDTFSRNRDCMKIGSLDNTSTEEAHMAHTCGDNAGRRYWKKVSDTNE